MNIGETAREKMNLKKKKRKSHVKIMQHNYMENKKLFCSSQLLQTETWIGKLEMCINKAFHHIAHNIHLPHGDVMPFEMAEFILPDL